MNDTRQSPKSSQKPFWKRILERHKFRGRLLRARVPLVLLRLWSPRDSHQPQMPSRRDVSPYLLSLYIQLSWPQWLVNAYGPTIAFEKSIFNSSAIKELNWLTRNPKNTNTTATLQSKTLVGLSSDSEGNPHRTGSGRQERTQLDRASLRDESGGEPSTNHDTTKSYAAPGPLLRPYRSKRSATTPRSFTELVKNRLLTSFINREVFVPMVGRMAQPKQTVEMARAVGESSHRASETAAVRHLRRDRILPALNATVEKAGDFGGAVPLRVHRSPTDADWKKSYSGGSRLYAQSAWLNLANPPAFSAAQQPQPQEQLSPPRPPASVQASQPQFDMGRLSEEVYRHIQRKIRVERERRGQ
jgi:hypothetical protein